MNNEKAALWPLKKWSPYARIVDGKPHGYMIGDKQGKWCFAESAEKQIHALQAEVDALKAEVAGLRGAYDTASQALHDLGIENVALKGEVARLSAPVTDAEWAVSHWVKSGGSMRGFVDAVILARATPPQDVEKKRSIGFPRDKTDEWEARQDVEKA